MTECRHCGARVDPDVVRVFGDNQGRMHRCPECVPLCQLRHAAHDPDWDSARAGSSQRADPHYHARWVRQ
jgi:hypothetical protein